MDKGPSTLIDAQQSALQPGYAGTAGLNQYVERQGQPYLSGAHIMESVRGPFGVPYWMQGLAVQTCNNMYISAPAPQQKSKITHQAKQTYSAGQYAIGQAPTGGVYTGVEDTCS